MFPLSLPPAPKFHGGLCVQLLWELTGTLLLAWQAAGQQPCRENKPVTPCTYPERDVPVMPTCNQTQLLAHPQQKSLPTPVLALSV